MTTPRGVRSALRPSVRPFVPERSLVLRAAATAAVCTGIVACASQGELPPLLAGLCCALVVAGNVVSHRFRREPLPYLKLGLGLVMVGAFAWFFVTASADAAAGAFAAAEPLLAVLFSVMQVAHSFDVPTRRDLGFSLAGSGALVALAAAQAVDLQFGIYVLIWLVFALTGLGAMWASMVGETRLRPAWLGASALACVAIGFLLLSALPSLSAPSLSSTAGALGHPGASHASHLVRAGPTTAAREASPAGRIGVGGYLGFAGALDTAVRASLGSEVVLRVRAQRPTFWVAETFEHWSGNSWSQPQAGSAGVGAIRRVVVHGPPFVVRRSLSIGTDYQTFYLASSGSNLVLHASHASEVWFPARRLYVSSDGTIQSPVVLGEGSVYSVLSTVEIPTPQQLGDAIGTTGLTVRLESEALELPHPYRRVAALARRVTTGQTTIYGKVLALEHWIGSHTEYTTDIPALAPGEDTVNQFLFVTHRGYCEQISTALAVMLRTLGIPAREAVGYVPGPYDPITGLYDEEAKDAHAWVQVWFGGLGWQSFDPTAYVPLANPSAGAAIGHDVVAALHRLPPVPTAAVAAGLALSAVIFAWRRRRPATWRAAVTKELQHAARSAGVEAVPGETLGRLAARIDDVIPAGVDIRASVVATAAERAAWSGSEPDRWTARSHVRHARRVRRAARVRSVRVRSVRVRSVREASGRRRSSHPPRAGAGRT